jgi:hypothetical protein
MPRLAEIYDAVEQERNDLDHYLAIAAEIGARSVLPHCWTEPGPSPARSESGGCRATRRRCRN